MKIFLIYIFVLVSIPTLAQQSFVTDVIRTSVRKSDGSWGKWKKTNYLIEMAEDKFKLFVDDDPVFTFIADTDPIIITHNPGDVVKTAWDKHFTKCTIQLTRDYYSGQIQIYIIYPDKATTYILRPLNSRHQSKGDKWSKFLFGG